jgi:hypothetical protein
VGHLRLYTLPDTPPWRRVVRLIADGASASTVAQATTAAATAGLDLIGPELGLALRRVGIDTVPGPEVLDVTTALAAAVDAHARLRNTTDLGEMARLAAVQTLDLLLSVPGRGPFYTTPEQVHEAARRLATPAGFGELFHEYFTAFAHRFLTYHLGRELSFHVGGNGRFADTEAHQRFVWDLHDHCRQATAAIRDRAADWFSRFSTPAGMTPGRVQRFVGGCLTQLRDGLLMPGGRDG